MQYNIKMYPYYYAVTSFLAFLPIFFLYFSSMLTLKEVLLLESVYYIAVVILEVPTGYISDLVGRRVTLIAGSIMLCLACIVYLIAGGFLMLALGQLFFALFMALTSGTNTVFHFESLKADQLAHTYGDREALVNQYGMLAGGTAALIGGWAATYGLSMAYIISLVAGLVSVAIAFGFTEPIKTSSESKAMSSMLSQITGTASYLKQPYLLWIFFFYMAVYLITHVPYEFYQPYLAILDERDMLLGFSVPIVSGILYAGARYAGAIGARYSMVWSRKLGLLSYLMICMLVINLIVGAMGFFLNSVVIMVVLFRSLPWAAIKAPLNAIITPAIGAGQRATFHSMLSLVNRLSFFLMLVILSSITEEEPSGWEELSFLLQVCFGMGLLIALPLVLSGAKVLRSLPPEDK